MAQYPHWFTHIPPPFSMFLTAFLLFSRRQDDRDGGPDGSLETARKDVTLMLLCRLDSSPGRMTFILQPGYCVGIILATATSFLSLVDALFFVGAKIPCGFFFLGRSTAARSKYRDNISLGSSPAILDGQIGFSRKSNTSHLKHNLCRVRSTLICDAFSPTKKRNDLISSPPTVIVTTIRASFPHPVSSHKDDLAPADQPT
jgi:hypothetical protein